MCIYNLILGNTIIMIHLKGVDILMSPAVIKILIGLSLVAFHYLPLVGK